MSLRDKLRDLPTDSGVYIYMDGDGKVLYVGKAKNLRNRVRQYFFVSSNKTEKVMAMLTHIADMRYIITKSRNRRVGAGKHADKKIFAALQHNVEGRQAVSLRKAGFAEDFSASGNNPQGG